MKGVTVQTSQWGKAMAMPEWKKVANRIFAIVTVGLVAGVLLLAAVAVLPKLVGLNPVVVLSGSMEPYLRVGDIAVTRPVDPSTVKVGDVVTYRSGSGFITHRVIAIVETPQGRLFELKGDNNSTADAQQVSQERVVAKVVYGVPKVGFVVVMANSQIGWTLFIIGPAVVLFLMWYWEREHKKVANR